MPEASARARLSSPASAASHGTSASGRSNTHSSGGKAREKRRPETTAEDGVNQKDLRTLNEAGKRKTEKGKRTTGNSSRFPFPVSRFPAIGGRECFLRSIGGTHERAGEDVSKAHRLARLAVALEDGRRHVLLDRQVLPGRAQVLTDREDVHVRGADPREEVEDFLLPLAQ